MKTIKTTDKLAISKVGVSSTESVFLDVDSNGVLGISTSTGNNGGILVEGGSSASQFDGSVNIDGTFSLNGVDITAIIGTLDPIIVTVSKTAGAGLYTTITDALASIVDASSSKIYVIKVNPGLYVENTLTMKEYVFIVGTNQSTRIVPNGINKHAVIGAPRSGLIDVLLTNASGTGYALVYYAPATALATNIFYMENVALFNAVSGANLCIIDGSVSTANVYCVNAWWGSSASFQRGFEVIGGVGSNLTLKSSVTNASRIAPTLPDYFIKCHGANSRVSLQGVNIETGGVSTGKAIHVYDGADINLGDVFISGWTTGVHVENVGASSNLVCTSTAFDDCTMNLDIEGSTSGHFIGYSEHIKNDINYASPFFIAEKDPRIIKVSKKGGDFDSISAACASIIDSSVSNQYVVMVGAGNFTEPTINVPEYVSVRGSSINTTSVFPSANNHHVFILGNNTEVSFLNINDAGTNYAALYIEDCGDFVQAHKLSIYNCYYGVQVKSLAANSVVYLEYCDINSVFEKALHVVATPTFDATVQVESFYVNSDVAITGEHIHADGAGVTINALTFGLQGGSNDVGVKIDNGATVELIGGFIDGCDTAVDVSNTGANPPTLKINAVKFNSNADDLLIAHPDTIGVCMGSLGISKMTNASTTFSWAFLDVDSSSFEVTDKLSVTFVGSGVHTDASTFFFEGGSVGLYEGGELSDGGGLNVDVAAGYGYVDLTGLDAGVIKKIEFLADTLALVASSDNFIYYNDNGVLSASTSLPSVTNNVILGRVVTDGSSIEIIDSIPVHARHSSTNMSLYARDAFGAIYKSGSVVSENVTPLKLDITGGVYYYAETSFSPVGGTAINFTQYHHNGSSAWVKTVTDTINNTQYNNGNTLTALTSSYYAKHALYVVGEGANEQYFVVLAQSEYTSLALAQAGTMPLPPSYFSGGVALIAAIYVQEGSGVIASIDDARPIVGYRASGTSSTADHSSLTGLANDDHTQYLLASGSRSMSGSLDMGTNNITNVGTVDGVDVSSHASRHTFTGADAFIKGTPVSLSDATNSAGASNTDFAAADHVHAHGARGGGTLHSEATTLVAGFLPAADKIKIDYLTVTQAVDLDTIESDNALNNAKVTNATHTGDATGSTALAVVGINGVILSSLGTGLLKNTTGTGVPSIAINTDLPTMTNTLGGAVPTPPNNTSTFLRGDATWASVGDVVGDDVVTIAQNIVAYSGTGGKNITELTGTQGDTLYHDGTSWVKLAAGTSGYILKTNGAGANPSWTIPANVFKVGTPIDNQVAVWSGDGTLEGDTALTFDTATDTLKTGILETSGAIELGNASDTTITRTAAGKIAVEGKGLITTIKTTVYTSGAAQTHNFDAGMVYCEVWCTGQGGGGGGARASDASSIASASGGGGGGTAYNTYNATEAGVSATYTVGTTGGTGGSAIGGNGIAGENSTFDPSGTGVTLTGTGGGLGIGHDNATPAFSVRAGGTGGTPINGAINMSGSNGSYGATGTINTVPPLGGAGGGSYWGNGGATVSATTTTAKAGENGSTYGAGGSGACAINASAGATGGNGAGGIIKIVEYIH